MSVGFSSCSKDDKKEEEIPVDKILGNRWYYKSTEGHRDRRYYLQFNYNNTYSYVDENKTINGTYKITESEKTKFIYTSKYLTWEWYKRTRESQWKCFADIKQTFNSADSVGNNRFVFDVKSITIGLSLLSFLHPERYISVLLELIRSITD